MRQGKFSRRKGGRKGYTEINMSPLLDLTFLLLVAFIITFPALQSGVTVKLPSAQQKNDALDNNEPLVISLTKDGQLFLGKEPLTDEALGARIAERMQANPKTAAHVRADEALEYGRIMEIIQIIRRNGLTKFSLVTESSR